MTELAERKSSLRALRYLLPYKGTIALSVILSLLAAAFRAASLGAVIPFLDVLLTEQMPSYLAALPERAPAPLRPLAERAVQLITPFTPTQLLAVFAGVLLVAIALRGVLVFCSEALAARVTHAAVRELAQEAYRALLSSPAADTAGVALARFTSSMDEVRLGLRRLAGKIYGEPFNVIMIAVLLFSLNARLALVCVVVFPVAIAVTLGAARAARRGSHRVLRYRTELLSVLDEGVRGFFTIRLFGLENREHGRFTTQNRALMKRLQRLDVLEAMQRPVLELVGAGAAVFCLLLGARSIFAGEMTQSTFVAFYSSLLMMLGPVRKMSSASVDFQRFSVASSNLFQVLDNARHPRVMTGHLPAPPTTSELRFDDVGLRRGDHWVLRHISFAAHPGEMVAIAGLSGAGKSTLLGLIGRLADPDQGSILLGGQELQDFDVTSLRASLGFVTQTPFLFGDTILENIRAGKPDATLAEVEAAAREAQADGFIRALESGYQTNLRERDLSAGERQRITLARALIRQPAILVLDEATSALDRLNERRILEHLRTISGDRIVLVVTHRLDALADDVRVLLLEAGAQVAFGQKEDLVASVPLMRILLAHEHEE